MKERKISIQISDSVSWTTTFTSLRSLYDFLQKERDFWRRQKERIENGANHPYLDFRENINSVIVALVNWGEEVDAWSDDQLNEQLNQLWQTYLRHASQYWLWSGHPFIEQFVQCLSEHGEQTAIAFLDYVARKNTSNVASIDHFRGYLYGYEYLTQESSIPKRRTGEKISLSQLRNHFAEAKDQLFSEVEDLKSEIEVWSKNQRINIERRYHAQKRLNSRLHKTQGLEGESKLTKQNLDFDEKLRIWSNTITQLEDTYREKLRLEEPAKYWKRSAKRYGIQGGLWFLCIVALVIVGVINFQEIFTTWLQGKEIDIKLNTVQGVVLFGSIAAIYAYLLKVLSRLTFSSFNLMRDSEEREQLTYLYLSLKNQSAVDDNSRDIILQALFSRTETGLLAQEHGPTMPGIDLIKTAARGNP
jgi:hypothetical protein